MKTLSIFSQNTPEKTPFQFLDCLKSGSLIAAIAFATGCQTTSPTLEKALPSETPAPITQTTDELPTESLQEQQLKMDALTTIALQSVEKQIAALNLTQPAEYNAWDILQQLEPIIGSEKTLPLKHKIIETYLSLAREKINPNSSSTDLEQAKAHISMARQLYHLLPETNKSVVEHSIVQHSVVEHIVQLDKDLKNQLALVNSLRIPSQQNSIINQKTSENVAALDAIEPSAKKPVYEKLLKPSDVVERTDQARQLISYQANRIVEENLRVVITASSMSDYRWISAVLKSAVNGKKSDFQLQCEPLIETESVPSLKFFQ